MQCICNVLHAGVPKVLDFTSSPHYVLIGQQLNLFCTYTGAPDPDADWLVNGSAIDSSSGINVTSNATYSVLIIENVSDLHDATYTCNVSNAVGSDQTSIDVNTLLSMFSTICVFTYLYTLMAYSFCILTAPPPAEITITTTGSKIAGEAFALTCTAVLIEGSTVTADVQWLHSDGASILHGEDVSIGDVTTEGVIFSRSLTFEALLASQAGEYICQASFPDPQSPSDTITSNQTIVFTAQSEL